MIMKLSSSMNSSSRHLLKTLLLAAALFCSASAANNIGRIDAVAEIEGVGVDGTDPNPTKNVVFASPSSSSAATHAAPVIDRLRRNRNLKRKKVEVEDPFVWPESSSTKSAKAAETNKETDPEDEEVKVLVDGTRALIQLGSFDEALEYVLKAIELTPTVDAFGDLYGLLDAIVIETIQPRRKQLQQMERWLAGDEHLKPIFQKEIRRVKSEINAIGDRYIGVFQTRRIPITFSREKLAALYKMLGDAYAVKAGVQEVGSRTRSIISAQNAYTVASNYASTLSSRHPINLGTAWSQSIFNQYVLNQPGLADQIAEAATVSGPARIIMEVHQGAICSTSEAAAMATNSFNKCSMRLEGEQEESDCYNMAKILACELSGRLEMKDDDDEVHVSIIFALLSDHTLVPLSCANIIVTQRRISDEDGGNVSDLSRDSFDQILDEALSSTLSSYASEDVDTGLIGNWAIVRPPATTRSGAPNLSASIVSQWTWAATLLQHQTSASGRTTGYRYAGYGMFSSGLISQSILFGVLASSLETVASAEQDDSDSGDDLEFSIATSSNFAGDQGSLGGICWFAIPFSLATSLGLSSTALMFPITANNEAGNAFVPAVVATIEDPGQVVNMNAVWFPISAFVALGLDHSVANMFIIPLGITDTDFVYIVHQSGSEQSSLLGRQSGQAEGYSYLSANKKSGIMWGEDTLFDYLENPFALMLDESH